jgi:hypothetical protein
MKAVVRELSMILTKDEKKQLGATFGCSNAELNKELRGYEEAAKEEYLRMILGQKVFTRGQDIREYRLFLLIKHVFGGHLPDERTISGLFQTSATQSRGLLRAVMSKYQYELQEAVATTLKDAVEQATSVPGGTDWQIVCDSENVIEALNRELAKIRGTLPQVTKVRGTVTTYAIPGESYDELKRLYGLQ